jgi:hypothetical protein
MWSKNKARMTTAEREHVGKVKESGCALCGAGGVVEAHEIEQGEWFVSIGLCTACHRGPNGLHGDKTLWRIYKMTEIQALNETLRRVLS